MKIFHIIPIKGTTSPPPCEGTTSPSHCEWPHTLHPFCEWSLSAPPCKATHNLPHCEPLLGPPCEDPPSPSPLSRGKGVLLPLPPVKGGKGGSKIIFLYSHHYNSNKSKQIKKRILYIRLKRLLFIYIRLQLLYFLNL